MPDLTAAEVSELACDLKALIADLTAQLHDNADAAAPVELDQTRVGRLSRMDAMQMQQQQKAERERSALRLQQAQNALKAIENEDYGWCRQCDESIGFPRLKIRPEAPLCISCQEKLE